MGVTLQRLVIPEDLVPGRGGYGNGRAIAYQTEELSRVSEQLGLTPIDEFIVDHCALIERAMDTAGWVEPRSPEQRVVIGNDPHDADYCVTRIDDDGVSRRFAVYMYEAERAAAASLIERIEGEVERAKPWYDPADGLRTVRGLMKAIRRGISMHQLEEARERQLRRLMAGGVDRGQAERWVPRPTGGDFGPALWDLRTFELKLQFAARGSDRFHLWVSY